MESGAWSPEPGARSLGDGAWERINGMVPATKIIIAHELSGICLIMSKYELYSIKNNQQWFAFAQKGG